jgi:hypothetical protein
MKIKLYATIIIFLTTKAFAQPAITPAAGYFWQNIGTASYATVPISTTPNITSGNTGFGLASDSDPVSCASFCAGNCDGLTVFGNSLFGAAYPAVPTSTTCEQRAVTLTQWTNTKPASAVPNGSSTGIVYLPTNASITILKATSPTTEGTGVGNSLNRGKLVGGLGGSNTTRIDVNNNYDISWKTPAFGTTADGSQTWNQTGSFTATDPGGSSFSAYNDWYAGSFGNTISTDNIYNIPINLISQSGGNFEVIFAATSNLSVSRIFGNADAFVEASPGMEGRAKFTVNYTIWELKTILPLSLTEFNAKLLTSNTAIINWRNETEASNTKYFLQRSYDAAKWETITTLIDQDINNPIGNYTTKDVTINPLEKQVYYKLMMEELNGKKYFSDLISLENNNKNNFAVTLLNDKKIFKITTPNYDRTNCLKIYNSLGQIVQQQNLLNNNQIINLQNLASGTYYFMLSNGQGFQKTIGVMVE